jgi:NADPH:quinone reductase-like Zn-dependent oxidoreductase
VNSFSDGRCQRPARSDGGRRNRCQARQRAYPVVLGRDYAGVVEHVGAAVSGYQPGDHVFGFVLHANPAVKHGAWAELITITEELSIGPAPDGFDLAIAGAAPPARITAVTAVDALDLSEGDVLLLAGATGAGR